MCDRTIKMKLNKDSILQDVNSNTINMNATSQINMTCLGAINIKSAYP